LKSSAFDLEEARLKEEIEKRNAKRVLIQLPEGLKPQAPRLATIIEKTGALAIVSADPCYGACDLPLGESEILNADLIVHYGHSPMVGRLGRIPVLYVEARTDIDLKTSVEKALPLLGARKRIGLVTTIQHMDMLGETREILRQAGKSVVIGDAGSLLAGQATGCNYSNALAISKDVDAFLFLGGGRFHAVGVALATSKPTVAADPYENEAHIVDDEVQKIIRQRWVSINEAIGAEHFGILVGLKVGQSWLDRGLQVRESLAKIGKKTTVLAIREVDPMRLMQFPSLEAYVNTACPRISLDDASRFPKPVLTLDEAKIIAGELTWEQLLKRGWFAE
jgi:2-(3-amino-3-carboxypropyl)histidine synthase